MGLHNCFNLALMLQQLFHGLGKGWATGHMTPTPSPVYKVLYCMITELRGELRGLILSEHPSPRCVTRMVAPLKQISFVLNKEQVTITEADPNVSLNEWIRSQPRLSGTKLMCGEGGCGCCVVTGVWKDPASGDETTAALNSVSSRRRIGYRRTCSLCRVWSNHAITSLWGGLVQPIIATIFAIFWIKNYWRGYSPPPPYIASSPGHTVPWRA